MATHNWEAWIGLSDPTVISRPLFKSTETKIIFTIIEGEERTPVNIENNVITFSARQIHNKVALSDPVTCSVTDHENGICEADLSADDLAIDEANGKDCYGEINIRSGEGQPIKDRVTFRFVVEDTIETT